MRGPFCYRNGTLMPRFEKLALRPPIEPMEARAVEHIPSSDAWAYEPKWDGFRCIAFREGRDVELESKSGQSLTRYFPEIVDALLAGSTSSFVVDGELFIERDDGFDFDALLQRIHPAASRVTRLSRETPASYMIFDLLVDGRRAVYGEPLRTRREKLEAFIARNFEGDQTIRLSPMTRDRRQAERWLSGGVKRIDGVIAKRDAVYAFGSRDMVVKIKRQYSADCVVGGFRRNKTGAVASLLLGLYEGGLLHHVGFVGSMSAQVRDRAAELLEPIVEPPGFTGSTPGGPSRWRRTEESEWFPVRPRIVVEVTFDHVTARRFRHAARFVRWRPDKTPRQCTFEQLLRPS
jgi:ATP-dependent DNA ligase